MCAFSFARSGDSAAAAGAAVATTAGTSARANFVAKFMSKAPGFFAGNWRFSFEWVLNPAVPFRSVSDGVPVGIDQHFAATDMVGLSDEAVLLHPLDQARRAVVPDAELALEVRGRGLLAFGDDL